MTRRQLRAAEWALLIMCVAPLVVGAAAVAGHRSTVKVGQASDAPPPGVSRDGHLADSLLRGVVEIAAFRLVRRPATAPYQLVPVAAPADASPAQRPGLSLSGIIAGRHPAALLDGVPGHDGSVLLQLGDTVAGLRLRRVGADRVVVTGMDTTWTLTLRQAWTQ